MVRTQIQLTEEQAARLKELANESNESIASIVRKALDQYLTRNAPERKALLLQAMSAAGKFKAGVSDISLNHDRYLEEDFGN